MNVIAKLLFVSSKIFFKSIVQGVDWSEVERNCFSEWSHPADAELGVQIVKDLHRTGCSLFCGEDGQENQALLKRVLLAYARWNKAVGEYKVCTIPLCELKLLQKHTSRYSLISSLPVTYESAIAADSTIL